MYDSYFGSLSAEGIWHFWKSIKNSMAKYMDEQHDENQIFKNNLMLKFFKLLFELFFLNLETRKDCVGNIPFKLCI